MPLNPSSAPDSEPADSGKPPRMLAWVVIGAMLFFFVDSLRHVDEARLLLAVALKALLVVVGGVLGYWLDRALFPYARPHQCLDFEMPPTSRPALERDIPPDEYGDLVSGEAYLQVAASDFTSSMIRRAIIVAACVLAMALGGAAVQVVG